MLARTSTEAEAWAARGAKALEDARNNPNPSCRWSMQHLTSRYGNFCFKCGCDMPTPHFYPSDAKKAAVHT